MIHLFVFCFYVHNHGNLVLIHHGILGSNYGSKRKHKRETEKYLF